MRVRFVAQVGLLLICLGGVGCESVGRPSPGGTSESRASRETRDQVHADLERELSLYSD